MIDFARITIKAGDGGAGSGSFFRIKGKRYGKAGGGDGGRGGDVYFEASSDLNNLEAFRYIKHYLAKNGTNGQSRRRKGADGRDLVIKVPVGTVAEILSGPANLFPPASTPQPFSSIGDSTSIPDSKKGGVRVVGSPSKVVTRQNFAYDLVKDSQRVLVARGGQGGRGNMHLRDEFGRRPKVGEKGQVGEIYHLTLELKLIADIGIIGLPNAGKSTLLSVLTAAKPKVAPYPFTTLEPNLGVLRTPSKSITGGHGTTSTKGSSIKKARDTRDTLDSHGTLILADIPGLIEGASRGRGLGDLFLRHIERTKILLHLIDISGESDKWQDYQVIRKELKAYSKELAKKKEIIVLNKADLIDRNTVAKYVGLFRAKKKKTLAISALKQENLTELVNQMLIQLE